MLSKLSRGNTYVLKARDNRRVVTGLHIMNPDRVTVKVAEDSSVFYQLATDDMQQYEGTITVPQTEIIHDRMNPLYHPLVGVPPIYASALAATQGLNIQSQSLRLFANNAQPGGLLIAPSEISPENAERLRKTWQEMYSGDNFGKIAVLGNAMKYEKLAQTADEAQLIEQLKWTAEVVCSTYHVPPYKIGVGAMPSYNNVQALNVEYYTQCLQCLIEDAESTLDDGLGLGDEFSLRTEFDIDNLLRMDGTAQADRAAKLVAGSIQTPNEARRDFGLSPLAGGDTVYMQQQNYSLEALAKRDAQADPFASKAPATPTPPADDSTLTPVDGKALAHELRKALRLPIAA
jgi:HK97 family phage portal protein